MVLGMDAIPIAQTQKKELMGCLVTQKRINGLFGGPSLSTISSSIKTKGKLKDVILEALNSTQNRGSRTASSTAVQWLVRHPGCSPSTLPGFVVQIS